MADTINNKNEAVVDKAVKPAEPAKAEKDKKDKKKDKKPRRPFKVVMKTWSHGLAKEASRISWEKKHDVLKDFITIILLCVFLAVLFFAIDMIVVSIQ